MSKHERHTKCDRLRRRTRRCVRWRVLAVIAGLAVLPFLLSACAAAESSGTPIGVTPVTVIATATSGPASNITTAATHVPSKPGYRLIFDDEFSGSRLNRKLWVPSVPWGHTNQDEQEYYSSSALSQGGGVLTLTASEHRTGGEPYTSGAISSHLESQFTYGYVEARVQIPAGEGLWSAFWLLTRKTGINEEADIMEVLGSQPDKGNAVLHYGTTAKKGRSLTTYRHPDFSAGFHTVALDWEPGSMIWYVDGVQRYKLTRNIPSDPMIIIANLAVGGTGSWPGPPDRYTQFPAQYKIDYIRVYQRQ